MKGKIELKSERENKSSCPVNFFNQQSGFSRLSFNVTKLARYFCPGTQGHSQVLIFKRCRIEPLRKQKESTLAKEVAKLA